MALMAPSWSWCFSSALFFLFGVFPLRKNKMSDFVMILTMLGILKYIVATILAFSAISIYFGFIKKA
jgi:hypothetical protein